MLFSLRSMLIIRKIREISDITSQDVFNSDQSKFEYELVCDRAYEAKVKGLKHVEALGVATNSLPHSNTLQVHINKAGFLGSHFYLCFQETGEVLPECS